jgi:hypothetical protein
MTRGNVLRYVLLAAALALDTGADAISSNGSTGDITALNANLSSGTATAASTVAISLGTSQYATVYSSQDAAYGAVGIQVTGTFTGTLRFQSSQDEGVTWVTHTVVVAPTTASSPTQVTTATSTGNWVANVAGFTNFRVTCTAYTSGTATVTLEKFRASNLVGISTIPSITATNASVQTVGADTGTSETLASGGVTTSAPTYTNGKSNPLSLTTAGGLRVDVASLAAYAADGASIAGVPVPIGLKAVAEAAQPTAVTAGQAAYGIATLERIPIVTDRHPNHVQCQVTVSTATTIQAVGGSCAAPGAGLSVYITDIDFSTNAAGITADSFNTLKSGTGGTCGSGTAVIWQCMTAAATQATCSSHLKSPIKVAANSEVCWINSTAGSKTLNIEGYIAP